MPRLKDDMILVIGYVSGSLQHEINKKRNRD